MASIPLDVLLKIETDRPDLVSIIHDIMATDNPRIQASLEKKLALEFLKGNNSLTPEETLYLSACCSGREYGDVDRSNLH
jgi:hypothetical protein